MGRYLSINDDGNAENFQSVDGAITAGIDLFGGENWKTGVAVGYAQGHVDANDIGSADFYSGSLLGYAGLEIDAFRMGGSIGTTYNWFDVDRDVDLNGGNTDLYNDFDGCSIHADIEGRYDFPIVKPQLTVGPVIGFRAEFAHVDSSGEFGNGLVALERQSDDYYSAQARTGIAMSIDRELGAYPVRATATVLLLTELGDDDNATADLELHGANWTAQAADPGRSSGLVGASIAVSVIDDLEVGIGYAGRFNEDLMAHQANLSLTYSW